MNPNITEKVARFPEAPGVYIFLGARNKALYVGKAANLRSRVKSYLKPGGDGRFGIQFLEQEARDVEFVATATEQEALLLENTVIKKAKPVYNVKLKDDKSFLLLRLDPREAWPWFRLVRRRRRDGARYFGPFASAKSVRRTLRLLHKVIPLRDCSDTVFANRSRPCIKHQLQRCPAPCVGEIRREAYGQRLEQAVSILTGKSGPLLASLRAQMSAAAEALEFERAQVLKQQIQALQQVAEAQHVVGGGEIDRDVLGIHRVGEEVSAVFLLYREGKLESSRRFNFASLVPDDLLLAEILGRYYEGDSYVPAEILLPGEPADAETLRQWLATKRGAGLRLVQPRRGIRLRLLLAAEENARLLDHMLADEGARRGRGLFDLGRLLGLADPPGLIHCLDVSTIKGEHSVASRVVFANGAAEKKSYRHFRISPEAAGNDFASMEEAVCRSLTLCLTREEEELPELLLVDGGRGQVTAAQKALAELGLLGDFALAGLAKVRDGKAGSKEERKEERLFLPDRDSPVPLVPGQPLQLLLAAIRDEAHRFAIGYHRKLRERLRSELDEVPGVGPHRRRLVLRHFGSMAALRAASLEALQAVPGLPRAVAETLFLHLRGPGRPGGGGVVG